MNYGTIDVGNSSAFAQYSVYQAGNSTTHANAINMSVSFKESTNASEARKESWVYVSTTAEGTYIESVGGKEAYVGSLVAKAVSAVIRTRVESTEIASMWRIPQLSTSPNFLVLLRR